jgi:fatty acid desaturase
MAVTGKTEKTKGKKGLMTLGGKFREEPYKADTPQVIELQQRLETARFIVMLFLVIIAIAFIIWAIYAGLFTELFNRTVEG